MMEYEYIFDKLNEEKTFISSASNENVKELFDEINNYSSINFFPNMEDDKYCVFYKGKPYVVGFYYGPEILYYVRFANEEEITSHIDYSYIKFGKVPGKVRDIKNAIEYINYQIKGLEDSGVSKKVLTKRIKI